MKKLFMAIFIPVLFILGSPALVATLMYDGTGNEHLPVHLYTDDYDAVTMVFEELDSSIEEVETGVTNDLIYNLDQDVINRAIYEGILEMNSDYAPGDDCVTDDQCYIFADAQEIEGFNIAYRVVGAWVSFYDGDAATDPGRFVFNVFVEVDLDENITYKTILEVHFLFEDDPDFYYLEFDKIQMGRLPLPKTMFTSIINIVGDQTDLDLESQIGDMPMGDFDLDNLSYTLDKDEILTVISEEQGSNDSGSLLAQELLSIIFDNQLVEFELKDQEFTLTAGISQFRSEDADKTDIPQYLYELHDSELVEGEVVYGEYNAELFDPETYLKDIFTEYIFNSSLISGGGFRIEEEIFNKLIYSGAEGFTETRTVQPIPISATEEKDIEFGLKAIWFEFAATEIYAHALFRIGGIDSLLVIRAEEVSDAGTTEELHFTFVEITFGKDDLEGPSEYMEIIDLAVFKQVFAELGDVEFGEFNADGDLIISAARLSALMQDGTEDGAVVVTGISLETGALVLTIEAGDPLLQQTLEDFQTALTDVIESEELLTDLEAVLNTTGGGVEQDVYESVVDLQATLTDPDTDVTPEQIEDLFENFDELDAETQEEFLTTIGDLIDPAVFSEYEDLFGQFSETEGTTTE